jgi:twitching motility protein PilT
MSTPYASESFLHQLLGKALAANASDIHLKVGQPPGARVRGDMVYFRVDKIRAEDTEALARIVLATKHETIDLDALTEQDLAYAVPGLGRFRVNVYRQRGTIALVLRHVPEKIPTLEDLNVPPPAKTLAELDRGLVLVCGAAGNGKSTTLAAMIAHVNQTFAKHIITIEDPIEFVHADSRSSVSQREVGTDTKGFAEALRAALRQDPDVVLVGEIRDGETLEIAMQAAETGHLVLSTMHTPDCSRTVQRMMSLAKNGEEMRERAADCLQGVMAQRLIPKRDGSGLVLCAEVLIASGTARESIRRPANNPSLRDVMEKGVVPYGMQTFDMALAKLAQDGKIGAQYERKGSIY